MSSEQTPKGPWMHRFLIRFFTLLLAILVFWALGFLVGDIAAIPGPQYEDIEKQHLDRALVGQQASLVEEIAKLERDVHNKRDEMKVVSDSSQNLQKTVGQLIELRKLAVQRAASLSQPEQDSLSSSLSHFLEAQKLYQDHTAELSAMMERKRQLESERLALDKQIERQRQPALEAYRILRERHDLRLAGLQLLVLVPLLGLGAYLVVRKRDSIYFPLFLGYGAAVLLKVSLVVHEYFPSRYFKYILILGLLVAVVRILIHFIRSVAFPQIQWLAKQYREGYERFLCPVCEYPVRVGPRRFLYWTRRTVNKVVLSETSSAEETYTCPSCGTVLFEECEICHGVRHSLLPYCRHCNARKDVG